MFETIIYFSVNPIHVIYLPSIIYKVQRSVLECYFMFSSEINTDDQFAIGDEINDGHRLKLLKL